MFINGFLQTAVFNGHVQKMNLKRSLPAVQMADGGIIHRTKEKDKGTYCAAKISFMIVHYNATESSLRNFCMHKHTWRLIDTINGAKASALVYSIVETAKENGVNPFRYLEFLLTEMMEHEEDTDYCFIDDLLPWSGSIPDICKMKNKKEH